MASPSQWHPRAQLSWQRGRGVLFLGCREPGLAPVACSATSALLPQGEGTLRCPQKDRGTAGVHASTGHEEGAGMDGAAVSRTAPWCCGCHLLWVHRS